MKLLVIGPFDIIVFALMIITLYAVAIAILFKNKSSIWPYLALLFFPIIAPIGIIAGYFMTSKN
ncbi:hypothetical protein CHRYSEOSP005_12060 [Chryseobacterium sp. Alg-005]|uniref:hypothetical protein n=1 Tax=Chryseobacterium sp. Alg-005 TaxID=3159516 RepID=UPI003555BB88